MKYHLISKKTMRSKDFASLKKGVAGYLHFKAPSANEGHRYESLFRTTRGWFMLFFEKKQKVVGEVSTTTAQKWLDECGIKFETGW